MTRENNVLLSIGHGYSAASVARRVLARGWRVIGTTRSETGAERLRAQGVEPHLWPGADLAGLVARATHVLSSVAPDGAADPVLASLGGQLDGEALVWAGYLSTTGVYGDHGGDWVDETAATHPASRRGQARLKAEAGWQSMCAGAGVTLVVFRLAGIYGPGRGPFQSVREGTARRIIKPGQVFNRIHVEDIALAVTAAMDAKAGGIFNICDDEPAPPQDVVEEAARLLGVDPPPEVPFDPAGMSPMAASFYSENKRVRNDLAKSALGVAWQFPTYREGLRALLEADRGRGGAERRCIGPSEWRRTSIGIVSDHARPRRPKRRARFPLIGKGQACFLSAAARAAGRGAYCVVPGLSGSFLAGRFRVLQAYGTADAVQLPHRVHATNPTRVRATDAVERVWTWFTGQNRGHRLQSER